MLVGLSREITAKSKLAIKSIACASKSASIAVPLAEQSADGPCLPCVDPAHPRPGHACMLYLWSLGHMLSGKMVQRVAQVLRIVEAKRVEVNLAAIHRYLV